MKVASARMLERRVAPMTGMSERAEVPKLLGNLEVLHDDTHGDDDTS